MKKNSLIFLFLLFGLNFYSQNQIENEFKKIHIDFEYAIDTNAVIAQQKLEEQYNFIINNRVKAKDTLYNKMLFFYYKNKSVFLKRENDIKGATNYIHKSVEVATYLKNDNFLAISYSSLGLIFKAKYNYDSALIFYKKGLNTFIKTKDSSNITATFHALSSVYSVTKHYDTAIAYLQKSLLFVDSLKYPNDIATIFNSIGFNSFQKGDYDFALSYYLKSLNIYVNTKKWRYELMTLEQIGALFFHQDDLKSANNYFSKALKIARLKKSEYKIASLLTNIGAVHQQTNNIDQALDNYKTALIVFQKLNNKDGESACYNNLGEIYLNNKEFQKAITFIQKGLNLDIETGNIGYISQSYLNLGQAHFNYNNKSQEAKKYCKLALNKAKEVGKLEIQKQANKQLFEVYFKLKEYDNAWKANKDYLILKDSIEGIIVKENIDKLKIEYETQLKEIENENLKSEVEIKNQKIKLEKNNFWFLVIVSIIVLLLLSSLLLLLFNRNKIKEQQLKIIEFEIIKQEKESQAVLFKLNESKNIIIEKNYVINHLKKEIETQFNEGDFTDNLLNKISIDNNWGTFMGEFEVLHKNFFKNLKLSHSNLSKNDFRLSALIKLSLSDKEIAALINIEYASVKKSKNRLKKKLNLSAEDKLFNYISSI